MMGALRQPTQPHLTVIKGGLGSPEIAGSPESWRIEEVEVELAARRIEELAMAAQLTPILRRLRVMSKAAGPVVYRDVAAASYLLERHARRWGVDGPEAVSA